MKIWKVSAVLIGIFTIFLIIIISLTKHIDYSQQDVVEINRVRKICETTWDDLNRARLKKSSLEFEVMNLDGELLFATSEHIHKSENQALRDRDTICTIELNGRRVGIVIFLNDFKDKIKLLRIKITTVVCIVVVLSAFVLLGYLWLIYIRVLRPFYHLKQFAQHIARGEFDFPLRAEKSNYFGEFTESLDMMREELNNARENERKADESKKELVAQLSHDIKTPIASIKAVTELMLALSKEKTKTEQLRMILMKADQVDLLVSNMFQATLEELKELKVNPLPMESPKVYELVHNADYDQRVTIATIPECIIMADLFRLQQVFDNIISNSYKYAGTQISIESEIKDDFLDIIIKDYGQGVEEEELPLLFMKFKRGKNAERKNGSGLGLYIADYLVKQMGGKLSAYNVEGGFCIQLSLILAR